ncbi:MAG: thioesterase family protein [Bacteroidota bacterium]|nr:thioesterase family protein [Bacteroidota bacterium]
MSRIKIELPKSFVFETEIPVRISDINYGGHVGNDAILSIAHEARVRFLIQLGYTEFNIEGRSIIMTDAAVQYKSQSFYGEVLRIEIGIEDFQEHGCDFLYRVTEKDSRREVARIKTGIVFFDYGKGKISELPEQFRAKVLSLSTMDSPPSRE